MGTIFWSRKVLVGTKQSSWYDHTIYEVPFTGDFDASKISNALSRRVTRNFLNKFGGQTHIGEVTLVREGVARVEHLYSIGD